MDQQVKAYICSYMEPSDLNFRVRCI